jgi:CubicO group peptidase (beta-lactamase class C family)
MAPGAAALVCSAGEILFSRTLGMREITPRRLPLEGDTLFDLASLTKVAGTAMAAARLHEEGKLDYDAPLGAFFADPGSFAAATVRQILTHSGGFIAEARIGNFVERPAEAVSFILRGERAYEPGTRVVYSCFGFIILGEIIKGITGLPLDRALERLVFKPLGMGATLYCPRDSRPRWAGGFAATEYDGETGAVLSGVVHDENARFLRGVAGNAGLFSTAADLAKWMGMLLAGGAAGGKPFLRPETVRSFYTNMTGGLGEDRGIGFKLYPALGTAAAPAFGHTGFTGTSVLLDPVRGAGFLLLTNRVHPRREEARLLDERERLNRIALACFDRAAPQAAPQALLMGGA